MKYEVGDIIKDKFTDTHYMIIKIARSSTNWYLIQSIQYGSTREYSQGILDTGFHVIQKVKR